MRRSFFVRFDWILDFGWVILTHEFPQKAKLISFNKLFNNFAIKFNFVSVIHYDAAERRHQSFLKLAEKIH